MAIKKDAEINFNKNIKSPASVAMIGKKYGRLLVLEYLGAKICGNGFRMAMVKCKCDCGSVHNYISAKLRSGHSKSCGCFQSENSSKIHIRHGHKSTKHGNRGTMIYARWRSMFDRVRSDPNYAHVKISDRWQRENGFVNFCTDMGEMPTPKHTVDRYPLIQGDYKPSNCRWATMQEQMQNMTRNVKMEFNGEMLCISEIARRVNIDSREFHRRLKTLKLNLDEAISYVPNKNRSRKKNIK